MKLRTLIVDDEPLARQRVRSLLRADATVEVVGEYGDAASAADAIVNLKPDLVFLDVQMPVMNGFEVLEATREQHIPAVIFVTAYDEYAVRAFEAHAIDYLLKPYKRERFYQALERARIRSSQSAPDGYQRDLALVLEQMRASNPRLVVRSGGRVFFFRYEEIRSIESAGNYVRVDAGGASHEIRERMNAIERRLPPDRFVRIHRRHIVNLDRVAELQPCGGGEYVMVLRDGRELPVGASYLDRIQALVHKYSA